MSATQSEKAKKFRALHKLPLTLGAPIAHAGPGLSAVAGAFIFPNPWDAGSARILAGLGFEALATTSAGLAFSLGCRDGMVSRDEVLAHCRAIVAPTDLPVAADLENCFGDDPRTVAETIRLAAATGIVGGSVEDASGDDRRPIYDHNHAVERVAAAVEAARVLPFPFTLTARAENFLHGRPDLDDTIRRLQAFAAAGAEVLYAPGLPSLEAIKTVCAAVAPRPVNALAGIKGLAFSVEQLAAAGVRRISLGGALTRLAYGALIAAGREMCDRGTFSFVDGAAPTAQVAGFMLAPQDRAGIA
ncbi:MAG TPA: isocitrate lyase/phosphoenolpyruvate mutase family protein [Candidatus Acidoferrales bacterium]|nr:isocitrate lyase/phosphoenolpyruvate mutase family protein [Candidatus Acidoferrales bacterium]